MEAVIFRQTHSFSLSVSHTVSVNFAASCVASLADIDSTGEGFFFLNFHQGVHFPILHNNKVLKTMHNYDGESLLTSLDFR